MYRLQELKWALFTCFEPQRQNRVEGVITVQDLERRLNSGSSLMASTRIRELLQIRTTFLIGYFAKNNQDSEACGCRRAPSCRIPLPQYERAPKSSAPDLTFWREFLSRIFSARGMRRFESPVSTLITGMHTAGPQCLMVVPK